MPKSHLSAGNWLVLFLNLVIKRCKSIEDPHSAFMPSLAQRENHVPRPFFELLEFIDHRKHWRQEFPKTGLDKRREQGEYLLVITHQPRQWKIHHLYSLDFPIEDIEASI